MLTPDQTKRAAIIIAQMAAEMVHAETTGAQHDVAYSMQEFALMLLGEGNDELTPSALPFQAIHEKGQARKVIVIAGDSEATLHLFDNDADTIKEERKMDIAKWLMTCGEIDLEGFAT